ncbi:hypothetical protein Cni_G15312 [Canna indica]|uniref:PHD finger family protein n=1 Tax=Canna indica TaxID=4628 RepID=A0AAQ3KGS4_9LILI|nr:hypothetical protein Cni_G15312 [Canna indica]
MSAPRCPWVGMMGRGADGRPGSPEGPSPAAAPTPALDLFAQARKALSVRCPFDGEESAPRVPTLPSGLASSLLRASDSHRKQKKSQGEPAEKPSAHGKPSTVWDATEEYFRPLTLADIDMLVPTPLLGPASVDPCLVIPAIGNGVEHSKKVGKLDAADDLASISLSEKEELLPEQQPEETEKVQTAKEEPLMGVRHEALPIQVANDDSFSLHWLLGSRERFILTSERPNNKRKLLGGDAGLNRLLLLPHSQSDAELCDFCCSLEGTLKSNKLLRCHSCNASVHQKCYGVHGLEGNWLCDWCKHLETTKEVPLGDGHSASSRPCLLCPKEGGALKTMQRAHPSGLSDDSAKFVHLFCSLWTPEVYVDDTEVMELVMDIVGIEDKHGRLVCNLCKVKHGVCIRCSHGTCRTSFHPLCARESKYQMEIWGKLGCANVELRAFCPKHSPFQDLSSLKDSNNLTVATDDHSLVPKPSQFILPTKKLPKLRFTRKSKDKSMMQNEITISTSEKIDQTEPDEQNPDINKLNSEGGRAGIITETDTDGAVDTGNIKKATQDVAAILRKLIGQGKISADDVASEMGISLDSLQAALVGETTSFSPGLRMKIIKWLQNSIHVSALKPSGVRSSPVVSSDSKVTKIDSLNAAKGKDPENNPAGDNITGFEVSDAVDVKSLSPCREAKSNIMIPSNDEAPCSSGVASSLETCDVVSEDLKGNVNGKTVESLPNNQKLQEMIMKETFGTRDSMLSLDSKQEHKERSCLEQFGGEADAVLPNKSYLDFQNGVLGSASNIHPLINQKLFDKWNSLFLKTIGRDPFANANSSCPWCTQQGSSCSCTDTNTWDGAKLDQLSKAKNKDVLELAPEDEVEGEILYFQSNLLDKAILIKHCYENLLSKIVQNLPHELSISNKHKWDCILVNQFLREVREAKKRGRKERRHKEAQAVLAAVAAAAVSSRNSSLRKDSNNEIILATQENPAKMTSSTIRAGLHSPLVPRAKESLRSSVAKLSSDKQSMAFQMPDFLKDNALSCEICMRTETILNRIFVCSSCKVAVHLDCYRRVGNPVGPWKCELCENMPLPPTSPKIQTDGNDIHAIAQCGLCGAIGGALRKSADGQWVHAFCAEWLMETSFRRGQGNLVEGMDTISKGKDTCCICRLAVGACLKCSYGNCKSTFHPYCASRAGFYMNAKITGISIRHKAYCVKHSIEQREADNRQCGAEDLKTLKQTRVELEKVRLLCERIIKREKLKRDLVICSHDILASRRDCVAYSTLVSSSFFHPGASSESATTSINNRSYSGTVQRSDEITVDSTVTGKRRIRFSFNNRDVDKSTDDGSTSKLSFKRKLGNRESFAGKQLPHRTASVASQKSVEDGEKKSKAKKETESFQKELLMTSDQASMHNQRLPKGFFYVPVGSLSKDKSLVQDSDLREPREPGG